MAYPLLDKQLLVDQSALGVIGIIPAHIMKSVRELAIYTLFGALTSAGAVIIEGAHDADFTGTWAVIATVTWAAANRVHLSAITGVHKVVRVRISDAIVGGVVNVFAVAD